MNIRVQAIMPLGTLDLQAFVPTLPADATGQLSPVRIIVAIGTSAQMEMTLDQAKELTRLLRSVLKP